MRVGLGAPGRVANGLVSGARAQFRLISGADSLEECEGWQFCRQCGTTVAHLGENAAALIGYLNQPLDALHRAVEAGDLSEVREMLARGVSPDLEIQRQTPLMVAIRKRDLEICRVLLEHGATARLGLTRDFFTQQSPELLRLLLTHGVRPQRLLRPILLKGSLASARVLLEFGVDLDRPDKFGFTALHCAAHNSAAMVRLVAANALHFDRLSSGGAHPLGFSALWGYTGRLKALLQAGFPVDLVQSDPPDTALFVACREGNLACVRVLLQFGADPNLRCLGVTPLMAASHSGSLACVELLLQAGADPTARDDSGRSAREYAVAPMIQGRHRLSNNSAAEPRVQLSYGRDRWTCCHDAIAQILPGDPPAGHSRLLSTDGTRLHSTDFTAFHSRSNRFGEDDWQIVYRAAQAGCAEAQCLWGFDSASRGWLRASAAQQWAQGTLSPSRVRFDEAGRMFIRYGRQRVDRDTVLAAELGHLEAMRDLAAALIHDEYDRTGSFAEGYTRALPWYCRAAERGHRESQVAGGSMLIQGDGAEPDPVRGLRFLEAAAQSDDIDNATSAARQLARYYAGGDSLPADPGKSEFWQHRAAVLKLEDDLRVNQLFQYSSRLRSP